MTTARYSYIKSEFERLYTDSSRSVKTHAETVQNDDFARIFSALIVNLQGLHSREYAYTFSMYEKSLFAARKGNLQLADQYIIEASSCSSPAYSGNISHLVINVHALPSVAFLRYKQGQYDEAEKLLIAAIDNDEMLLAVGVYIIEYHRVQQLHNLSRLFFHQNRIEAGALIIKQCLRFLLAGHKPEIGTNWSFDAIKMAPAQLRIGMLLQVIGEINYNITNRNFDRFTINQIVFNNLTEGVEILSQVHIAQWITLKNEVNYQLTEKIIADTIDFLLEHSSISESYKIVLLLDIVDKMKQHSLYDNSIYQLILSYIYKSTIGTHNYKKLFVT